MFASAPLAHRSPGAFAGAYRKVGVETGVSAASPHQLVTMLFDGFNESVAQAKRALLFKDIEGQVQCDHARRADRRGRAARSPRRRGRRRARRDQLKSLYGYITLRLTQANLHNDVAALDECLRLIEPVRRHGSRSARAPKPAPRSSDMPSTQTVEARMNSLLMNYYEAIEKASQDMLEAARAGNWDQVVKLEGACAVLIAQLKNTAAEQPLPPDEAELKSRLMQRILINDAEIRQLAEPWLEDLDDILAGRPKTLH